MFANKRPSQNEALRVIYGRCYVYVIGRDENNNS